MTTTKYLIKYESYHLALTTLKYVCIKSARPKVFLPLGPLGPKGYCRPFVRRCLRRRRRRTHYFGYYTNMVQQIIFIIHTNIQPLPALFFTQGQGHRSKGKVKDLKKILLTR